MEALRALFTLGVFASFLGIVWWAYAPSRRQLWQERGELRDD
jgi:cbb3-type cytochrome oxidase subunit 3